MNATIPNLDTMPSIEDAQEILTSIEEALKAERFRYSWYGEYLPNGTASIWLPLNKHWGLKIFKHLNWGPSGYEGAVLNAIYAFEHGIGPYMHAYEYRVKFCNNECPAFFMQRAEDAIDKFYGYPELHSVIEEWKSHGFYDIHDFNSGILDGKLVLIDTSHRKYDW